MSALAWFIDNAATIGWGLFGLAALAILVIVGINDSAPGDKP